MLRALLRLRPAPSRGARAAAPRRRRPGRRTSIVIAQIDLRAFGHSALTADIAVPKGRDEAMSAGIPITYVPARNTIFLSFALAWAEVWKPATSSSASTPSTIPAIPIAVPNSSKLSRRWPTSPPKPASKAAPAIADPHAAASSCRKPISCGLRRELGVDFALTHSCYDPDAARPSLRRVRFLPAARAKDSRGRHCGRIALNAHPRSSIPCRAKARSLGVPSVFIRTSGCNLRCSWCDTPYTSWKPEGDELDARRRFSTASAAFPPRHVVVTGGEPMIAPEIVELTERSRRAAGTSPSKPPAPSSARRLRSDEHQPEACEFDAARASGPIATTPAHPAGVLRRLMARVRLSAQIRDRAAGRSGGSPRAACDARRRPVK